MLPKSADGYSRLSKELQVGALILGGLGALMMLMSKLYGHVDLIDPNLHEYEMLLEQDRRINEILYNQECGYYVETLSEQTMREFYEEWDRDHSPGGCDYNAGYDNDRGIERDGNSR